MSQSGWYSVVYGDTLFVAVAWDGLSSVMTSTDGIVWTGRTAAEQNEWRYVTYGAGLFVAVARNVPTGRHAVMTSPDGINWTSGSIPGGSWDAVAHGNGRFVAVSSQGTNRVAWANWPP